MYLHSLNVFKQIPLRAIFQNLHVSAISIHSYKSVLLVSRPDLSALGLGIEPHAILGLDLGLRICCCCFWWE